MSTPENTNRAEKAITPLNRANLHVISLMAMLGGWALLIAYAVGYFVADDARFIALIWLEIAFASVLTVAWLLQWRGKHSLSAWTLFATLAFTVILFNFLVEGLGLTLGIVLAITISMIAWQTLPARSASLAAFLSVLSGILIYLTDTYFAQGVRIDSGLFLSTLLIIAGGLVIFILVINGLRGVEFSSISSQLRVSYLIIALIPILIITLFQTATLANVLTIQANNNLISHANTLARELDTQLFTILSNIMEDASRTDVINLFKTPNKDTAFLVSIASRYPGAISYGLLDKDGFLLLDNHGVSGGKESEKSYFYNAAGVRITSITDVVLDETTRKGVFFASTPVLDSQGNLLGVIRIKFNAQILQNAAEEAGSRFGESLMIAVFDDANIILAQNLAPDLVGKVVSVTNASSVVALRDAGRLPLTGDINANLEELGQKIKTAQTTPLFTTTTSLQDPELDYAAVEIMRYKPWKVMVAQHATDFLAPVVNQITIIAIIIFILVIAVYFGANLTASMLVTPVNALSTAARRLGDGNLDTAIQLPRKDELGIFATVLDNTRQQVYELLQTLEERVEERTAELTRANQKNERRAMQLETISQVARAVTSLRDVNELLPEITQQISDSFGYYHAGIFLLDEYTEYAVLRAANSEGGQVMLARGHRLKVGRQGIVGNVTNTGRYRIALDVGDDAVFFNNPDLPNTRSEIALPLKIGERIIGALDVQSTEANAFSEDDVKSLSLLSDQISVAIENARLFDETRQALAQIQEIYTESSVSGWQSMVKESSTSGYRYTKGSVEPLHKKFESLTSRTGETLDIPIMLRGEKLGELKIRRSGHQVRWNETETRMYEAIVERMSFALENARLFSDARRRANLERISSEAATKISSSVRFETILRTAAEEISRLLDGSEVLVQIQPGAIDKIDKA